MGNTVSIVRPHRMRDWGSFSEERLLQVLSKSFPDGIGWLGLDGRGGFLKWAPQVSNFFNIADPGPRIIASEFSLEGFFGGSPTRPVRPRLGIGYRGQESFFLRLLTHFVLLIAPASCDRRERQFRGLFSEHPLIPSWIYKGSKDHRFFF